MSKLPFHLRIAHVNELAKGEAAVRELVNLRIILSHFKDRPAKDFISTIDGSLEHLNHYVIPVK